jgi:hypothetical protein
MADITMLILADHDWFREQFARLDDLQAQTQVSQRALERVWRPLGEKLDLHAYEELENTSRAKRTDFSLGIGSLKGK